MGGVRGEHVPIPLRCTDPTYAGIKWVLRCYTSGRDAYNAEIMTPINSVPKDPFKFGTSVVSDDMSPKSDWSGGGREMKYSTQIPLAFRYLSRRRDTSDFAGCRGICIMCHCPSETSWYGPAAGDLSIYGKLFLICCEQVGPRQGRIRLRARRGLSSQLFDQLAVRSPNSEMRSCQARVRGISLWYGVIDNWTEAGKLLCLCEPWLMKLVRWR